jgi:RHS repeat-associated protein
MKAARLAIVLAILFVASSPLRSQTAPNFENGWKPYGSYDGSHLDTVNLMNGNLMLHAPLVPNGGQRGALSLQYLLFATSKDWQTACVPDPSVGLACSWRSGGTGITFQPSIGVTVHRTLDKEFTTGEGVTTYEAYGYSIVSADLSTHQVHGVAGSEDANGHPTKYDSIDLSGYHLEVSNPDSNGVRNTATVTDRHGNQYQGTFITAPCGRPQTNQLPHGVHFAPIVDDVPMGDQYCSQHAVATLVTDSNGNRINVPGPLSMVALDTLGRTPALAGGAPSDSTGCGSAHPFFTSTVYAYADPNGATQTIKACWSQIEVHTAFGQSVYGRPIGEFNSSSSTPSTAVTSVILADGTKWTFDYDNYGEIISIGLPTGGSITYTWTTVSFANCDVLNSTPASRAVATRTLNDGQGHTYLWQYHWGASSGTGLTNYVTDPAGNDTVHVFTAQIPSGGLPHAGCDLYETITRQYQGPQSGQLIQQVETGFSSTAVGSDAPMSSGVGNIFATDIVTTVYPRGKVKKVHRDPDTGLGAGLPIFGNVKKELEYDWGQGAPGPLLRETDTTYQWEINSDYLTAHLLDLPASVIVKDGSGNRVAETDYVYDEAAYLTTPTPAVTTQHVSPPYGIRGNQTTVSRWLNTTNSFIASHTNWYDTGEVYQSIDPLGHTSTHSYDPVYMGAYATQTCSPQTGSVTHCVSGTYDFNTGVLTSLTNENATAQASGNTPGDGPHTSNYGYDSMFRITSAQAPPDPANSGARAQNLFTFSAPNVFPVSATRTKSVTNVLSDSATSFFDGLGRGYKSQHVLPDGTATVDTTFDLAGHAATVSNPYFTSSDPTYGLTQSAYDALDRVTQTTKQDGSISSVAYNVATAVAVPGDCTQTTDEAGKQRRACADGLGRLVEVDETGDSFSGSAASGSFTVSGALQSGTRATGTVTLQGSEQSKGVFGGGGEICDPGMICDGGGGGSGNLYDSGTVTITVNGHAYSYSYTGSDAATDTAGTIAAGLASAINGDAGAVVTASASGEIVSLTAKAPGPDGNYSLSSSYVWDSGDFSSPSFTTVNSGAALTGGSNSGGVYDAGSVSVTIGAFTASVAYGNPGNGTATQVASALATALNVSSSPVTASASGATVSLNWKTIGTGGNATVGCSASTSHGAYFSGPSFTCPASTGLSGGFNPQGPSLDHAFYATLYFYDALGNLVCVEQHGSAATGTGCSSSPSNDATSPWRVRRFTYDSLSRLLTAKNPESGTITYAYDNDGELLSKTSPAPNQTGPATQTVSYCYDELHRVTGKGYGAQSCPLATPVVTYAYDSGTNAKGHLTSLTDQPGTANYSYDILGRLITETRTLIGANNAAISKTISYTYNLDGSVKTLTYPSGNVITYTPDSAGRVLSAVDSGSGINYVTGATYGPDSALTGFISGNSGTFAGITNAFSYNKRLQPLNMSATAPSQTVFSIGYDFHAGNGTAGSGTNNGNVWGITNYKDTTRNQVFTYDPLNRLISAQNAGTDCNATALGGNKKFWGNTYGYDAWGNLLAKTKIGTACAGESLSVTVGVNNRLGSGYLYDAAGNMTFNATAPTQTYIYDQENRLTGAAGYAYTYDADGNRVRKSNGNLAANGTLYWYMTPGVVAETDLAGTLKSEYVFFDGERVARRDGATGTGGVFYYFSDHLKTASVITDASGVIKAESDYYPWGGELQFINNDSNDYKFTGKKRDVETGLDYFGARYYSNGLGRWVSADWSPVPIPVPYANFGDPQSLNLYGYVRGLPTTNVDLDGHDGPSLSDVGQFLAGAANAYGSDNLMGAGRMEQTSTSGKLGAALGDGIATIQGVGETLLGATGEVIGFTLDGTGVGALVGVPMNIASAGLIVHGSSTALQGGVHLAKSASESGGKPYKDTPQNKEKMQAGKAPTGEDGKPVELHHEGQENGPVKEMTQTDHRLGENFKKNHPNTGQAPSKIDRKAADKARRDHWKKKANEGK